MRHLLAALAISAVAAGGAMAQTTGGTGSPGAGGSKAMGQQGQKTMKLSQAECEQAWNKANPSNAASITEQQAQAFITDVKSVNPDQDGKIERNEFMNACDRGLVKSTATTGAGAGTSGSEQRPSKLPPR